MVGSQAINREPCSGGDGSSSGGNCGIIGVVSHREWRPKDGESSIINEVLI
jgi:hypothetical protein